MSSGLRGLLKRALLGAEAVFNRAFGEALNPLYHLGSTTFYLFWIVAGTGLYLYAFFDTSVAGAYASVHGLADTHWGFGGVVRGVHRYASDAMVVTMILHLLRYWILERMRGFRWFSWCSGVVLLWLVFAAGANGYMLPWDRLAQFVTVASFEWLDWLPGFGGTLVRNFMYDQNVSDRLFSLLVFMHIGVPLLGLALIWVHVQRVPKAATQPPLPIALSVALMLVILAVLLPALSQGGPARLAAAPTLLSLDWFLLGLYPLVYLWPVAAVWALVLGASAALLALPWIGARRIDGASGYRLTLHPGAQEVEGRAGETLLEAGLRAGLLLPFDCRAGGCGECLATVINGRVDHGDYQRSVLTGSMRARGQTLMCTAVALGDVEVEVDVDSLVESAASRQPQRHSAVVESMERLAPDVIRLWLKLPAGQRLAFVAGQYINVVLDDGERRAYSFANPPPADERIELHVRRVPGGRFTTRVFEHMREGDAIDFEGPLGRFALHESDRPILFIAGATGFAPIKSILEDAFARGIQRPMWLYWGVRERADLYLDELAVDWAQAHPNFHYVPVLSEPLADGAWSGRRGLVHEAMLADFPQMQGFELYACGSVRMIEAAVPDFVAHGLAEDACYSDAFVPAHAEPAPARGPNEPG